MVPIQKGSFVQERGKESALLLYVSEISLDRKKIKLGCSEEWEDINNYISVEYDKT